MRTPYFLKQGKILHVARSNLKDVRLLRNSLYVFNRQNFGHDGESILIPGFL